MQVEVRFGLAKVEITWVESTLYFEEVVLPIPARRGRVLWGAGLLQGGFDPSKTTPWDTVFGLIVRCLPGPNKGGAL